MTTRIGAEDLRALGSVLRAARKEKRWTQGAAAEAVGISARHYGNIERGLVENPKIDTLRAIIGTLVPGSMRARIPSIFGVTGQSELEDGQFRDAYKGVTFELRDADGDVHVRVLTLVQVREQSKIKEFRLHTS